MTSLCRLVLTLAFLPLLAGDDLVGFLFGDSGFQTSVCLNSRALPFSLRSLGAKQIESTAYLKFSFNLKYCYSS